jgi:hypothetical protein
VTWDYKVSNRQRPKFISPDFTPLTIRQIRNAKKTERRRLLVTIDLVVAVYWISGQLGVNQKQRSGIEIEIEVGNLCVRARSSAGVYDCTM